LVAFAQQNLAQSQTTNVKLETGDGSNGWGTTEYDAILVCGSVPAIPDGLRYQLRVGGRLVVIAGQGTVMTPIDSPEPLLQVLRPNRFSRQSSSL
jgi:protein-L-isoaspartate(D-aspartate) O-methyltransferase